jgi:hypothetical protein
MNTPTNIPAEIWYLIFEFATLIPGISECTADEDAVVAFACDGYNTCSSLRIRQSMNMKLVINKVCSAWRRLVHRLLFECLSIKSGQQAMQLAALLQDDDSRNINSNANARMWWTRRLELAIDGVSVWTTEHTHAVIWILRHCPNLLCFSTAFSTLDPYLLYSSALVDALQKPGMDIKLKRIELKADSTLFRTVIVALADSLEVVWLLSSRRAAAEDDPQKLCLPRLHTFISDAHHRGLGLPIDLPVLRTLISRDTSERILYILRNGRTLRYLSVTDLDSSLPYLTFCPNLHTLVLGIYEIAPLRINHPLELSHSHLQTLIVENADMFRLSLMGAGSNFAHRYLPNLLSDFSRKSFPALRRIRLVFFNVSASSLDVILPALLSVWKKWLDACRLEEIDIQIVRGIEQLSSNSWIPLTLDLVQELL